MSFSEILFLLGIFVPVIVILIFLSRLQAMVGDKYLMFIKNEWIREIAGRAIIWLVVITYIAFYVGTNPWSLFF